MRSFFLSLITLATTPVSIALGSTFPQPSGSGLSDLNNNLLTGPKSVIYFINTIANWIFAILITISVIYILLAAYNYLSSKGGEGVETAHKMLFYAAVGIAIAVLAKGIVFTVRVLVDDSTKAPTTNTTDLYNHAA